MTCFKGKKLTKLDYKVVITFIQESASEVVKMKLKEGLVKFLDEMCNEKSIDRNVMKRICIPASKIGKFVKTLKFSRKNSL